MNTLTEKIAIVTGGSGGIGAAVCQKLATQVVVMYRFSSVAKKHGIEFLN